MLHSRTPEEYPENLGLPRPEMIRANFDKLSILYQSERSFRKLGFVQLLTFWGVGWKPLTLESDRLGAAHLALIAATLQSVLRRGTRITLLLGDNHARANEVPDDIIESYCECVEKLAAEFRFSLLKLSSVKSFDWGRLKHGYLTREEAALYASERVHYEKSARRLHPDKVEFRARRYFAVRYRERLPIATRFADAILASSDIFKRAALMPPLPNVHINMFPYARLRKSKPWFLNNY